MNLSDLGNFRIEKTEDFEFHEDKSYGELIRVRGSDWDPLFHGVPSHIYKYSERELGLYLRDHKHILPALEKALGTPIPKDDEIIIVFPVSYFKQVAKVLPLVRKKSRKKPMSPEEKKKAAENIKKLNSKSRHIFKKSGANLSEKVAGGNITLDSFNNFKNEVKK